jgi:hypothetical protein
MGGGTDVHTDFLDRRTYGRMEGTKAHVPYIGVPNCYTYEAGFSLSKIRIDMLCSQFLASAMRIAHPLHENNATWH